jgi:GxxExxY protein
MVAYQWRSPCLVSVEIDSSFNEEIPAKAQRSIRRPNKIWSQFGSFTLFFFAISFVTLRLCGKPAFIFSMDENELSRVIVDAAYKIHVTLGLGLLESVYEAVLACELERRGLRIIRQQAIPVVYDEVKLELGFRADIIVNDKVVLEVKSVDTIAPVHAKQLRTYLRLMDLRLGLLINFNVNLIKEGITRAVNNL